MIKPFSLIFVLGALFSCTAQPKQVPGAARTEPRDTTQKYNTLTAQEEKVLLEKATDRAFTGTYFDKKDKGLYICRRCNNPLYISEDKFESHCGWPSFDDEIDGSVIRVPDTDGMRTEIICGNCRGHLGHVFIGEGFTDKDTRHCVNTSSLRFVPAAETKSLPPVIK